MLYSEQTLPTAKRIVAAARELGISEKELATVSRSGLISMQLASSKRRAKALSVSGTPTIFLISPAGTVWRGFSPEQVLEKVNGSRD